MKAGLEPETCDICGRHILFGERTREYLTPERERYSVCDLCRARAQRAGWVRADRAPEKDQDEEPDRPRRRSWMLRQRFQRRRRDEGAERGERGSRERRPAAADHLPAGNAADWSPERRIRRALDRFNSSEHRRTVEGLTRSLGEPRVAAIAPAEAPDQVRLTVAWNLSWYQWKVQFSGHDADVRTFRNGKEIAELGAADRAWNARAGSDGRLQLGAARNGDRDEAAPDEPSSEAPDEPA